jgi:flavin-dependent dehydrogenase
VAREAGLISDDPRYTAVSQRAYAENVRLDRGEAAIVFDTDLFPGYGWMFPMAGGTANIGVGILSEARDRYSISVTALFRAFIDKLRRRHPGCADIQLAGKPLGGIVKTYGGAGRNYFDRGVLVGDAGCFVDPMTGEGITPALESALIASSTLAEALQSGKTEARHLASFERDFRKYFDPAMRYLDLCAAIMRNRHMRHFWLRVALNGYRDAATDPSYASVTGATFGGLDIRPAAIFTQIWTKMLQDLGAGNVRSFCDLLGGRIPARAEWAASLSLLSSGWLHSFLADPLWHSVWAADVLAKWATVCQSFNNSPDPRFSGPALA